VSGDTSRSGPPPPGRARRRPVRAPPGGLPAERPGGRAGGRFCRRSLP